MSAGDTARAGRVRGNRGESRPAGPGRGPSVHLAPAGAREQSEFQATAAGRKSALAGVSLAS